MLETEGRFHKEEFYPLSTLKTRPSTLPLWKRCWRQLGGAGRLSVPGVCAKLPKAPVQVACFRDQRQKGPFRPGTGTWASLVAFYPAQSPSQSPSPTSLSKPSRPLCSFRMPLLGTRDEWKFRKSGCLKWCIQRCWNPNHPAVWASWVFRTKRLSDCSLPEVSTEDSDLVPAALVLISWSLGAREISSGPAWLDSPWEMGPLFLMSFSSLTPLKELITESQAWKGLLRRLLCARSKWVRADPIFEDAHGAPLQWRITRNCPLQF